MRAAGGLQAGFGPEFTVFVILELNLLVVVVEEGAMMAMTPMRIPKRPRPSRRERGGRFWEKKMGRI
jgi:hypothetical protein